MQEEQLLIVKWVNDVLGPLVASLFHIQVQPGHDVIPSQVIMAGIVVLALMAFVAIVRSQLSIENPGKLQQALEVAYDFLRAQREDTGGHDGPRFVAIIGTMGFFILGCNLLGLVPGLSSPSSNINIPAACALTVILFYHYQGVRKQGLLHYLKHFAGPVWRLAPILIPIEIITHIPRPVNLTFLLFVIIFAEEKLVAFFFGLGLLLLPLPFMGYVVFGGFLQAFIFISMAQLYLAGAIATEEH